MSFRSYSAEYGGRDHLFSWIATIDGFRPGTRRPYCGGEKIFVDALVGANPGVIDLEMALPSVMIERDGRWTKVAPRMDLVALEDTPAGAACIVFWEAKLMSNGELRAKGDNAPPVLGQLQVYRTWAERSEHASQVVSAYRAAASAMVQLWKLAEQAGANGAFPTAISRFAATEEHTLGRLAVDPQPRVVILDDHKGDSWSGVHSEKLLTVARVQVVPRLWGIDDLRFIGR